MGCPRMSINVRLGPAEFFLAPIASSTRFRVVLVQGECPLGRREGDVITVGRTGSVMPALCTPAEQVLRRAVATGDDEEIGGWCCPVFDHMLVFRRLSETS